ncbi:MAG TPA: SDR family oxidoreductase [Flavisolibacter sp.]|nr:SDR family oxidoreductase [Flavisolibacter sp.]
MNVVITGASRGIGKSIAEKFAGDGQKHMILLAARDEQKLAGVAKELQERFPSSVFHFKACDLGSKEEAQAFGAWVLDTVTTIDVLINNAGTFVPGNISDEADGALENMLEVNLYSAYHLTRSLLPHMISNRSGHIFTICSIAGLQAYPNGGAYSISKFALLGFTKNLRHELKPHNIKVTAVIPGAVYTDSWKGSGVPPERIMEAEDIAQVVYSVSHLSPQATVEEIVMRPQQGDL